MGGFVLTNAANADMKSIGRYTQNTWGVEQRNSYLSALDLGFHQLAENPYIGLDCSEIRSNYRKHPIGRHLVFYRQISINQIEIVRILHERMDVEAHLAES